MYLIIGGIVVIAGILLVRHNIDQMIYFPPQVTDTNSMLTQYHRLPVPHYIDPNEKLTGRHLCVFYHGNATDAYRSIGNMRGLGAGAGTVHMYMEYPGYSLHPDTSVSTAGIRKDVETFAQWIKSARRTVYIVGQSIGTGPACYLAYLLRDSPGTVTGLELITPFINMCALAGEHALFGSLLAPNCYPNDYYLSKANLSKDKIIIHHGTNDEIIPYSHAVALSRYGTLRTHQGAMHNTIDWNKGLRT